MKAALGPSITVGGGLLCLILNWPGHLSFDSVVQLSEGRFGVYSGAHPPVMSWLLGIADAIHPGASIFIVFQATAIAGAIASLIFLGRGTSWATGLICAVFTVTPQLLIYPAIVWKDVLFASSATMGFSLLALVSVIWRRRGPRSGILAVAAAFLVLAALTRQNGAIVLPFAAVCIGWIAFRSGGNYRIAKGLLAGLGSLMVMALVVIGGTIALASQTDPGPMPNRPWRSLQTYDIVNALSFSPAIKLPILRAGYPALEQELRTRGVALYSPVRADTLEPIFEQMEARSDSSVLIDAQWRDLILRHPILYLRARARTFGWVFLTPDHDQCLLIYTGVDGPAEEMSDAGLTERKSDWDDSLADYAMLFAPTPIYSHAAYAVLALAVLFLLLRRREPPDIAVASMIGAALAFAASFSVISIACDYRYLYDLDLAAIAGTIYAAATCNGVAGNPARRLIRFRPFSILQRNRSSRTPERESRES